MNFLIALLKRFTKKDKKILGRWNVENCDTKTNTKIDLSNEDHCGPCGQYILDKTKSNTNNNTSSIPSSSIPSSIPSSNKILNNNHTSNINNNKYENII